MKKTCLIWSANKCRLIGFLTFLSTVMFSSCISMQNLSKDKFSHKCNILPRLKRCNNTADMIQTQRFLRNLFTTYQKSYNVLKGVSGNLARRRGSKCVNFQHEILSDTNSGMSQTLSSSCSFIISWLFSSSLLTVVSWEDLIFQDC